MPTHVPSHLLRKVFLFLVGILLLKTDSAFAQLRPRLTDPIQDSERVTLTGNIHPLARGEFDLGAAPPDLLMSRMLLVLKRGEEQEAELQKLLQDQQDKSSPRYHQWLTPEQFGQQFGPADEDIQTVTQWLESQGFQGIRVGKGRAVIEFSGTAAHVQRSFGTSIHRFLVDREEHWANSTEPSIPAALSPAVAGVFTLHNFFKKPDVHVDETPFVANAKRSAHPEFTSGPTDHALAPADFEKIYNFDPSQVPFGSNSTIAVVARSNINTQDVLSFQNYTNRLTSFLSVVLNGPDPGDLGGDDELEAVLDATWAGLIGSHTVQLVVSQSTATTDGIDLSELYIIDNNLADVMSESFGTCEGNATSSQAAGVSALAQQAAAQGITYVVSAGDSGSAGCDDPHTQTTASHPASVNLLAATPYTVAVGGTQFNENGHNATYWSSTTDQTTLGSAISYIPENVWNESCKSGQSGCTKPAIWAGGGGSSKFFSKPSWQTGVNGIPADGARDLPDVSLTTAAHDPYLICLRGSCNPDSQGKIRFVGVSGTSASAPAFAAIIGFVAQKAGTRLGVPNYILYRLAAAENLAQCNASSTTLPANNCVFNDVTVGNNAVPGETGYGTGSPSYKSGAGYDLATGLGSVNIGNLISQWSTVTFNPTTTSFSINPTTVVHGSGLNVTGSVTHSGGAGTPTGTAWIVEGAGSANLNESTLIGGNSPLELPLDSSASFSGAFHSLPGGTYQLNVHYSGDQVYGGSDGTSVPVTVQAEPTTVSFSVLTKDAGGNLVPFTGGPFGTSVYFQTHLSWASGIGKPSEYVLLYDHNASVAQVYPDAKGDAISTATQLPAGQHSITAAYYGDFSLSSSFNNKSISFSISQIPTSTTLTSKQSAQSLTLTATLSANATGTPPTGSITFTSGSTVLGTSPLANGTTTGGTVQATASFDATQLATGTYSVVATYQGDTNYTSSTSAPVALNLLADFALDNRGITSQTVHAGTTATYINDLAITPFFGYMSSAVMLTCSVPATGTACTINPPSVSLSAGQPNIATISVTTTARGSAVAADRIEFRRVPWTPLALLSLSIAGWALLFRPRMKWLPRVVAGMSLALLLTMFAGCGGGGSAGSGGGGPATPPPTASGTPAGTYTVTATGTSGSATHTTSFNLVVQ